MYDRCDSHYNPLYAYRTVPRVHRTFIAASALLVAFGSTAVAQNGQPADKKVEELKDDVELLTDEVMTLQSEVEELRAGMGALTLGSNKFLVTGYGTVGFTDTEHGNSSFSTSLSPLFLWKASDKLLFSAELQFGLEDHGTETELEYANAAYIVNDHLTLRFGKLLTPLSTFQEHQHPTWINKLPNSPMFAAHGGHGSGAQLVPITSLGAEARGGFTLDNGMKLTYSAIISNGPVLDVDHDPGTLEFNNFADINNNKAIGGRIGFLPIPELEIAYGFQYAGDVVADGEGFDDVALVTHVLAVSYVTEKDAIGGRIEARAEFVLNDFDTELDFGSGPIDLDRQGGYLQVAYRPTLSEGFVKDLEGVVRYDFVDQPSEFAFDSDRYTAGVNYWVSPSAVFKLAYMWEDAEGSREGEDALMLQFAIGF